MNPFCCTGRIRELVAGALGRTSIWDREDAAVVRRRREGSLW